MDTDRYHERKREQMRARCAVTESGCWEWQGFVAWNGYGQTNYRTRGMAAHRAMWICTHGPIPESDAPRGLFVCHKCDNRRCINPDHLFLGTALDNEHDKRAKGRNFYLNKTHCKRGHPLTGDNVLYVTTPRGTQGRQCRTCNRRRLRLAAGWPAELADHLPPTPHGHRPVNGSFKRL